MTLAITSQISWLLASWASGVEALKRQYNRFDPEREKGVEPGRCAVSYHNLRFDQEIKGIH